MDTNAFLEKGKELISLAIVFDSQNDYPSALKYYKDGIHFALKAMKYMDNPKAVKALENNLKEHMTRAEVIQKGLKPIQQKEVEKGGGTPEVQSSLSSAIVTESPNVKWEDIAGLHNAKMLLKEVIVLPRQFPQLFTEEQGIKPWKGILLYGVPGGGKTILAAAAATEAKSTFFSISSSDLMSKWLGDSEKAVKQLFELARQHRPSIIFIDEIDSLCGSRGGSGSSEESNASRKVLTEFLVQMDGVGKDMTDILVLGATNTPWSLDAAIRRRFEKRIYIPLPDVEARNELFRLSLSKIKHTLTEFQIEELSLSTDGYSGADIKIIMKDALYQPVRFAQQATHFKPIPDPTGKQPYLLEAVQQEEKSTEDIKVSLFDIPSEQFKPNLVNYENFRQAIQRVTPTVSQQDLKQYEEWTKNYGEQG